MKLVHQINLAFGLLLAVILGATAVIIHYVLLDHLIDAKKQEMITLSASVANDMEQEPFWAEAPLTRTAVPLVSGVQAIFADTDGNVVSGTLPTQPLASSGVAPTSGTIARSEPIDLEKLQALQNGKDNRFIVAVRSVPQGTLTLVTPMSTVSAIERALYVRLLIVLGIGAVLVLLLSLVITRKLINPLMKLREELKKVKERRFAEVREIRAGGEIGTVAQTVHELAGELDRYIQVQKQFFQNASHELKTPLMSISGYAEAIRDGVFEGEHTQKGLDIIISESSRLKRIVSEMTLLAKLDSEADIFHPAEVAVQELLEETAERVNPLLKDRSLSLAVEYADEAAERTTVSADRDKLSQALLNVVANAARHASRAIEIRISLNRDQVRISVADDGRGIPEELLPHLFHRFVKGKEGENGLGLAISRAIVERCGGQIEAANQPNGGALFSVTLPAL
ncbi:sensor histidine kinase [Paenibacillus phocaensis]|uniref:sensor histidine kinase n=1 Tax=Paenibacillus phocaensis TaxID=1776378 RepID=UPI0003A6335F|nr:HAMP domain-containing sensor histidine kinase [Paenibacillus phocaensis]